MKKNSIKERAKRVPRHIKLLMQEAVKYELENVSCMSCGSSGLGNAFIAGYKYAQEQTKLKNK